MVALKTLFFGVLFFGSIIYVDYRLRNAYKPPRVDWPEEIQAAEIGDTLIIQDIKDGTLYLGFPIKS